MSNTNFIDPTDAVKPDGKTPIDTLRTSAVYKQETHAFLTGVRGRTGTTQTTANILLEKIANELKRNGITSYDPDAYELAVGNCTIILGLPGSTVERAPARSESLGSVETVSGNDGRGVERLGRPATRASDKPADVGSTRPGNRGQGGKASKGKG